MKNLIKKLFEFLKDVDGQKSSKRLITILAFAMFAVTWGVDLFSALAPSEYMVDALLWMVAAGLGTIVVEKFSRKKADTTIEKQANLNVDLSDASEGE